MSTFDLPIFVPLKHVGFWTLTDRFVSSPRVGNTIERSVGIAARIPSGKFDLAAAVVVLLLLREGLVVGFAVAVMAVPAMYVRVLI